MSSGKQPRYFHLTCGLGGDSINTVAPNLADGFATIVTLIQTKVIPAMEKGATITRTVR